jgi:hypothetical protein
MITMSLAVVALSSIVAAVTVGPEIDQQAGGYHRPNSGVRQLATRRAYPANVADDARRPGFGGRLWVSSSAHDVSEPGPKAYGAPANDDTVIYARVVNHAVSISPWQHQEVRSLEAARQEWLKENGYTGGVRTFVNDASPAARMVAATEPASTNEVPGVRRTIEPRGIIQFAPEATKFRKRMQVRAVPHTVVVRQPRAVADAR